METESWYDEREEEAPVILGPIEDVQLPVPLTFYFQHNGTPYEAKSCTKIYTIQSVVKFWQVFNNTEFDKLLEFGTISLQVKDKLPLWDMDCGTFSNIIHIKERGTWKDACLFLLQKVLNKETQFNGITLVVKKQRFFNLKVSTTGKNEELDLPEYFCKSKFMMNNEREKQVVKKKRY